MRTILEAEAHQLGAISQDKSQVQLTPLRHPLDQLVGLGDVCREMEDAGVTSRAALRIAPAYL